MRYSIELKDIIYAQVYGVLYFAKNISTHETKFAKNLSVKYSQKLFDSAKKFTTHAIKAAS